MNIYTEIYPKEFLKGFSKFLEICQKHGEDLKHVESNPSHVTDPCPRPLVFSLLHPLMEIPGLTALT